MAAQASLLPNQAQTMDTFGASKANPELKISYSIYILQ